MGVAGTVYDTAMVEAALFRSGGVKLENYAYGPATNPDPAAGFRKYVASGKGVGHVYVHTEGGGDDISGHGTGLVGKSRYVDHMTMVGAIVEALASNRCGGIAKPGQQSRNSAMAARSQRDSRYGALVRLPPKHDGQKKNRKNKH